MKADDAEPVADSDEEDETMQNADIAALKAQIEVLTKAVAGQTTLGLTLMPPGNGRCPPPR